MLTFVLRLLSRVATKFDLLAELMCSSSRPATVVEFTFANIGPDLTDKEKNTLLSYIELM